MPMTGSSGLFAGQPLLALAVLALFGCSSSAPKVAPRDGGRSEVGPDSPGSRDGTRTDASGAPRDGRASDGRSTDARSTDAHASDAQAADGSASDRRGADAHSADGDPTDAQGGDVALRRDAVSVDRPARDAAARDARTCADGGHACGSVCLPASACCTSVDCPFVTSATATCDLLSNSCMYGCASPNAVACPSGGAVRCISSHWDFDDSSADGWSVVPLASATAFSNVRLVGTGTFSGPGALQVDASFATTATTGVLQVTPCAGSTFDLRGRTISFHLAATSGGAAHSPPAFVWVVPYPSTASLFLDAQPQGTYSLYTATLSATDWQSVSAVQITVQDSGWAGQLTLDAVHVD